MLFRSREINGFSHHQVIGSFVRYLRFWYPILFPFLFVISALFESFFDLWVVVNLVVRFALRVDLKDGGGRHGGHGRPHSGRRLVRLEGLCGVARTRVEGQSTSFLTIR